MPNFVKLASAGDLLENAVLAIEHAGRQIAIYRVGGALYATTNICSHEHAYLSDGVVVDCIVECPFHQGRFDVRTGAAMGAPVIVPLQTFPVQVVDGRLFVRVLREQMESLSETMPRPR